MLVSTVLLASLLLASCSSSDGDADQGGPAEETATGETSSTAAPNILGLSPDIGLAIDDCWAEIPPLPETTTTTSTTDPEVSQTEAPTSSTIPKPLEDVGTTIPQPTIVANVDCAGTNEGKVYATFCLGANAEASTEDPTEPVLVSVPCDSAPGSGSTSESDPDASTAWPGDRLVRRAAVRICLSEFEQIFGQSYASSDLEVEEFAPTEGIWGRDMRSVVCWVATQT